jgi:hypothetical protein
MIAAATFKKQIAKPLREHLLTLGFKGSGFNYLMEIEGFFLALGIQGGRFGGRCCVEFGVHPKAIDSIGEYKIDFKKLKYYECEFRKRLTKSGTKEQWWAYSNDEFQNLLTGNDIYNSILDQVMPTVVLLKEDSNILDRIDVTDLDNIYKKLHKKIPGFPTDTTDIRFAWALTKVNETRNPKKARQFAEFGLSLLESSSTFFGKPYFEQIVRK